MLIKNGRILCGDGEWEKTDILCGKRILRLGRIEGEADIDAAGKYVIPGLVDIHTHGAVGADVSDGSGEGLKALSRYYAAGGVTSWCASVMALPKDRLIAAMRAVRSFRSEGADCVGIHLEGPFLSRRRRGAQNADFLRQPDAELFRRLQEESGGKIRMVTVAPEEDPGMGFIRTASGECTVAIGHSAADYRTARAAFDAGASHVTHLFNGMSGFHHREPGIIGAAFDAGATAELICDGLHVHPAAVRLAWRLFGERLALVSDSIRCAGMPDGMYELGGQPVTVKAGKTSLPDGALAGSSVSLMDALQAAVRFGIPFGEAVRAATRIPARVIGMDREIGKIAEGYRADLLILDSGYRLETVITGGEISAAGK